MIPVYGANIAYERRIHDMVGGFPPWYTAAAKVRIFTVTPDPVVREQIAMYRHGTRDVLVSPGIGDILRRALAHELAHGFDDQTEINGNPHVFSTCGDWIAIHRAQPYFELPKYRDDPREYFADMASKTVLLGVKKMSISNPRETAFIGGLVFPALMGQYQANNG